MEFQVAPQQPGIGICRVFSGNPTATQVAVQHPGRGGVSTGPPAAAGSEKSDPSEPLLGTGPCAAHAKNS